VAVLHCLLIVLTITDLRVRLSSGLGELAGFLPDCFSRRRCLPMTVWRHICPQSYCIEYHTAVRGPARRPSSEQRSQFSFVGVAAVYKRIRGREGMGMGDVKMMACWSFPRRSRRVFDNPVGNAAGNDCRRHCHRSFLYLAGWHRKLAERASRGLGNANALRWAIASQYQLPSDVPRNRGVAGGVLWSNDDAAVVAIICVI